LGVKCGGNFKYSGAKNVKDCGGCHLPHIPEYYDTIISRLKEAGNRENKKDGV
jgi:Zn-finger protein